MFPGSYRGTGSYSAGHHRVTQKYGMPQGGMGTTVPALTTITTSQDFQWMVQPTVIATSTSNIDPRTYSYPALGMGSAPGSSRAGVIRAYMAPFRGRRQKEEELSPEEEERRKLRRERNKLAAAKCRNRRRELTERLQAETDQLEDVKSGLQKEIADLQKEKERLEFILEAHQPICKVSDDSRAPLTSATTKGCSERPRDAVAGATDCSFRPKPPRVAIEPSSSRDGPEPEALHTPTVVRTPSGTPYAAGLTFTYPGAAFDLEPSAGPSGQALGLYTPPEPCAAAHRRGSSSGGDQSSDSLSSPTLVTL
ncbi:fos-related antigen 1-like [Stegostoma tigrinum]|uniref:fos-related antigen 1-like n=1 Tax=Stegostoma tigrinum TaxID=3053191 RepID=UPI002870A61E|nr:fos-related antigen 1-like [Stegostoma tigrinum]